MVRTLSNPQNEMRTSHARTPHHLLNGTVTPNSLHFSINHSGIPDIDPGTSTSWSIHGMVKQPLAFTLETLSRYPLVTRMAFVECSGNTAPMFSNEPVQATVQALHGLVSNAEWTGVPLSILLDEAGIDRSAKWLIAEGADSLALHRSVPVKKAYDDALVAIYQNGERLMPGNGYPMRLLLPGYQGNMNVKFLRRIKVVDEPSLGFYEARTYSQVLPDGKAWRFHFLQEVKSFITQPVVRAEPEGPGLLRDFRHRLFGHRPHLPGEGLGRRRQELGRRGAARPGASAGVHALPHAMALGRPAGGPAKSRLGRGRQRAAAAVGVRGAARRDQAAGDQPARRSRTSTTTASPAGASTATGRSNMSTRNALLALALAVASFGAAAARAETPGLGKPIAEADVAAWDIAAMPSGAGLPPGSGTAAQGAKVFAEKCVACHGEGGKGGPVARNPLFGGPPLSSAIDAPKTIGNFWGHATTVFDFTRRAMPFNQPRRLPPTSFTPRPRTSCSSTRSSARTT